MNKQIISFTLEPELDDYLRRMAKEAHLSISQYLRNLIWTGYETEQIVKEEQEEINKTKKRCHDLIHGTSFDVDLTNKF